MRDGHVGFTPDEHGLAANLVNEENGRNCHNKVDNADNSSSEKRDSASGKANLLENGWLESAGKKRISRHSR